MDRTGHDVHHRDHAVIRVAIDHGTYRRVEGDAGHECDGTGHELRGGGFAEGSGFSLKRDDGAHTGTSPERPIVRKRVAFDANSGGCLLPTAAREVRKLHRRTPRRH